MIAFEMELPANPVQVRLEKNADGVVMQVKLPSETVWVNALGLRHDKTYQVHDMTAWAGAVTAGYDNLVGGQIPKVS